MPTTPAKPSPTATLKPLGTPRTEDVTGNTVLRRISPENSQVNVSKKLGSFVKFMKNRNDAKDRLAEKYKHVSLDRLDSTSAATQPLAVAEKVEVTSQETGSPEVENATKFRRAEQPVFALESGDAMLSFDDAKSEQVSAAILTATPAPVAVAVGRKPAPVTSPSSVTSSVSRKFPVEDFSNADDHSSKTETSGSTSQLPFTSYSQHATASSLSTNQSLPFVEFKQPAQSDTSPSTTCSVTSCETPKLNFRNLLRSKRASTTSGLKSVSPESCSQSSSSTCYSASRKRVLSPTPEATRGEGRGVEKRRRVQKSILTGSFDSMTEDSNTTMQCKVEWRPSSVRN